VPRSAAPQKQRPYDFVPVAALVVSPWEQAVTPEGQVLKTLRVEPSRRSQRSLGLRALPRAGETRRAMGWVKGRCEWDVTIEAAASGGYGPVFLST